MYQQLLGKYWGTVSRESAPRAENFDSPVTAEPSGKASCFFTISHTFSTVSGLACTGATAFYCW